MILHVDMDAFYASVEERDNPDLVGKPVIVGGTAEGRGVVCAANYVARQYGIHSAMPAITAVRLCPQGVFLPLRMEHYAQISREIREILDRFTPLVEPLSLDEAFLDVSGCEGLFGPAPRIGKKIKEEIRRRVHLVASVGVAPNKFLAKIASDLKKPNGFVVVDPHGIHDFLDPLPVGRLWGIGKVSSKAFQKLGITTIGQLRQLPLAILESHFGKSGRHFWQLANGIDDRRVIPDREAKSISHETTFAEDIGQLEVLREWLMEQTEQVARRLRRHQLVGRTVQLKIRFQDFSTITRSQTLREPTNITQEIWQAAAKLLTSRLPARRGPVRLLGVGVSGLESRSESQGDSRSLFDESGREKQEKLDAVTDKIQERFGSTALGRAAGRRWKKETKERS
ncbi:MAG TPA: DNA polymerase IV [Gemmataceae bacterium]|nr:DNA polymerase IV [Gemmataceae bacterium]